MELLEVLSETVIDILKEFSMGRRSLDAAALKEAFSGNEEMISLLYPVLNTSPIGSKEVLVSGRKPDRVPLDKAETKTLTDSNKESLPGLRNAFLTILESLGPVIKGDHEIQFSELQKKISESESPLLLGRIGEQIGTMVRELIDEAVERIAHSNDFLVELSKDLYKMEEQLLSYQNNNREAHLQSRDFHDDLLLYANDMHRTFDSGKNIRDVRQLITSKISVISQTIEAKRQSDEVRLRETDAKMVELQNNLRTYNQEILQVRERADSLEKEVLLDELTQVNNRRAYDLQLRENLRRYHRNGEHFSLILMDVDHFKRVNDDYGHKAGDKCLQEIAKLIKISLRKSDFLARYGGEELIAILHGSDVINARQIAEKIRLRIEKTRFCYHEEVIPITISLGVTEVLPDDIDPEVPFIRVDKAMYQAKEDGRNKVCMS